MQNHIMSPGTASRAFAALYQHTWFVEHYSTPYDIFIYVLRSKKYDEARKREQRLLPYDARIFHRICLRDDDPQMLEIVMRNSDVPVVGEFGPNIRKFLQN
jgi:hypothetical protein